MSQPPVDLEYRSPDARSPRRREWRLFYFFLGLVAGGVMSAAFWSTFGSVMGLKTAIAAVTGIKVVIVAACFWSGKARARAFGVGLLVAIPLALLTVLGLCLMMANK